MKSTVWKGKVSPIQTRFAFSSAFSRLTNMFCNVAPCWSIPSLNIIKRRVIRNAHPQLTVLILAMIRNSQNMRIELKDLNFTFINLIWFRFRCRLRILIHIQWHREGEQGERPPLPPKRKNCCRNLVSSSRGLYFRGSSRKNRKSSWEFMTKVNFPERF